MYQGAEHRTINVFQSIFIGERCDAPKKNLKNTYLLPIERRSTAFKPNIRINNNFSILFKEIILAVNIKLKANRIDSTL